MNVLNLIMIEKENNLTEFLEIIDCFLRKIKTLEKELDQVRPTASDCLCKYCDISSKIYDLYHSIIGCELYYYPVTIKIRCIYDLIGEYTKLRAKSITLYQRWKGTSFNINYTIPPKFSNRGSWNIWKRSKFVMALPVRFSLISLEDKNLIKNLSKMSGDEDYIITYLPEILQIYIRYLASVLTEKVIFPVFCEYGKTGPCSEFCKRLEEIFKLLSEYILSTPNEELNSRYMYDPKVICSLLSITNYYYPKLKYQIFHSNNMYRPEWKKDRQFQHINFGEDFIENYFKKLPKESIKNLC